MNVLSDPLLPSLLGAVLFVGLLSMDAAAQKPADPELQALLTKLDAGRVPAAKAATQSLSREGTYVVTFAGAADGQPAAKGTCSEVFVGADLARMTVDMGPFGAMERGIQHELVWEVDPSMGAKIHTGDHAAVVRRYFAVLRGASLAGLYQDITRTGTETIDGREHSVLRLTPAAGKADIAYVDADGVLSRIDMALPVPESANAGFGLDDKMLAKIEFADWKTIDGVRFPARRTLHMGPATVAMTFTKTEVGAKVDAAKFTPPAAIGKLKPEAMAPAFDADGKPNYQIVERKVQPIASIRVQCKASEISAQLGSALPEVMAQVTASGGKTAGPPFARYHSFADGVVDLEAGFPVQDAITEKGRVKNSELPGGRLVTCWHVGPYEKLTGAHEALAAHLAANKLKARGGVWEIYWTDPGMVTDQAKWRTQLFAPIE